MGVEAAGSPSTPPQPPEPPPPPPPPPEPAPAQASGPAPSETPTPTDAQAAQGVPPPAPQAPQPQQVGTPTPPEVAAPTGTSARGMQQYNAGYFQDDFQTAPAQRAPVALSDPGMSTGTPTPVPDAPPTATPTPNAAPTPTTTGTPTPPASAQASSPEDAYAGPERPGQAGLSVSASADVKVKETKTPLTSAETSRTYELQAKQTDERVEPTVDGPRSYASYSVSATVSASTTWKEKNAPALETVNADQQFKGGQQVSYEAKAPTGTGVPNPFDPDSMAVGSQVTISEQQVMSRQYTAAYNSVNKPVQGEVGPDGKPITEKAGVFASSKVTTSSGPAISVEKIDDHTVRASVGPVEGVKNEMTVGVQREIGPGRVRAGLTNEQGLTDYHLDVRDFDLRTPEGRQAYQDFIDPLSGKAGQLPPEDPAHGIRASTVDSIKYTNETSAFLEGKYNTTAGSTALKAGLSLGSNDATVKITRNSDGSEKVQTTARWSDQTMSIDRSYNPDGTEDVSKRTYNLALRDLSPASAEQMATAYTGDPSQGATIRARGNQDVQLTFTQDEMDRFLAQARSSSVANGIDTLSGTLANVRDEPTNIGVALAGPRGKAWLASELAQMQAETGKIPGHAIMVDRSNPEAPRAHFGD